MEAYCVDSGDAPPYHVTILVQNEAGLKNLYQLITQSHLHHFRGVPLVTGADLQQHRRAAWERMAERYFSAEDQKRLAAAENAETLFFRIWTEEESYGKWRGTGLSGSLGTEKKEGFCTHFSPEKGYEGAVWAAEPVKICMKRIEP